MADTEGLDRLEGLADDERFAAIAVARVTGAIAEAHDVGGKQGAFDVLLTYPDRRTAALEVTSHAGEGVRQTYALLGESAFEMPNPGAWWWSVTVGDRRDVPRLRQCYAHLIVASEADGVTIPHDAPWVWRQDDDDVRWLREESSCQMFGHPDVPAVRDDGTRREVMVTPEGEGGSLDEELSTLPGAVSDLLTVPHISRRAEKVGRAWTDERHLFVHLIEGSVPPSVHMAMMGRVTVLPTEAPSVPEQLTHLWLTTGYGPSLIGWNGADGWTAHEVYG